MRSKIHRAVVALFIPAFAAVLLLLTAEGAACKSCKPNAASSADCTQQRAACLRPAPPRGL